MDIQTEERITDTNSTDEKDKILKTETLSTESEFDAISEEWNTLVDIADVEIFQTYEWQRTWWKFFGGNNDLHILLIREGNQLVGIVPMFLDYFKIFGTPVYKCLRMLGSRIIQPEEGSVPVELAFSDYLSAIVHPDYEQQVYETLHEYMQSNSDLYNEIIFEELPEENPLLTSLFSKMKEARRKQTIKDASVCPIILFPETWDELLGDLSSNARYQIRRDIRRVTDDELFELKTSKTEKEVKQAFEDLVEFHQRRWHNLGQPGIFSDKRILEFFREVTLKFHHKNWLLMKSLTAEGQCVAVDLLFRFKDTIYMIQRGFDDSSEYNQYGPGNVLLYCVIKEAIEEGFAAYDFLRGEESYKMRTANHILQNREVILQDRNKKSGIRPKVNELIRKYAHFKRKIYNERQVVSVHLKKKNPASAIGDYVKEAFHRGIRKFRNSTA